MLSFNINVTPITQPDTDAPKAVIDHKAIHQAILDIGYIQAQLDSTKITLYQVANQLRHQEAQPHV